VSECTDQADGLVKDGQWVEKDGLVHDIHEANADTERPPR
jgi:hypothetical protein